MVVNKRDQMKCAPPRKGSPLRDHSTCNCGLEQRYVSKRYRILNVLPKCINMVTERFEWNVDQSAVEV